MNNDVAHWFLSYEADSNEKMNYIKINRMLGLSRHDHEYRRAMDYLKIMAERKEATKFVRVCSNKHYK